MLRHLRIHSSLFLCSPCICLADSPSEQCFARSLVLEVDLCLCRYGRGGGAFIIHVHMLLSTIKLEQLTFSCLHC